MWFYILIDMIYDFENGYYVDARDVTLNIYEINDKLDFGNLESLKKASFRYSFRVNDDCSKTSIESIALVRWIKILEFMLQRQYREYASGYYIPQKDFHLFFTFLECERVIHEELKIKSIVNLIEKIQMSLIK